MKFTLETAELFVPDGCPPEEAWACTTHLALPLPAEVPEWLSPMVAVLPGQLLG